MTRPFQTISFYMTILLFAFVLLLVVSSFGLKADARVWPQIVGIPVLILLALSLVGEFSPKIESMFEVSWEGAAVEEGMEESQGGGPRKVLVSEIPWRIVGIVFGSLLLAALGVLFFGFLVAVPLYVLLFLRLFGGASWLGSALLAAGTTASLWGLATLVRLDMYKGVVFGAMVPPF
jgi:hypothetical protein